MKIKSENYLDDREKYCKRWKGLKIGITEWFGGEVQGQLYL